MIHLLFNLKINFLNLIIWPYVVHSKRNLFKEELSGSEINDTLIITNNNIAISAVNMFLLKMESNCKVNKKRRSVCNG